LTPGVKPYTELRKQQLALKYLDFCERREKFGFVNRFKKSYEACMRMNDHARDAYLHNVASESARNHERDCQVLREASRVKNLRPG
jgi:hypothetical protein